MLVLDAGNALFKSTEAGGEPKAREKAGLLLEQMNALGTTAMAVGLRDLVLGTDFLAQATKGSKMKLLSANLVDAAGKALFPASTVVTVGGLKFGLVGLSPEGPVATQKGVVGKPPVPAALAESRRLREQEKVDLVVVLAALPHLEAFRLSRDAGTAVDFIVQSHDSRSSTPQRTDHAFLLASGERGKQLGRLELSVGGPGPFVELEDAERTRQNLKILDENIQQAKARLATAKDESARKALREAVTSFEFRRKVLAEQQQASTGTNKRTLRFSYIQLGAEVTDDPELKKRVERLEPPSSHGHDH